MKISVVGSLNMDLVTQTEILPQMGETITGTGFSIHPGGKGANQAVAAARLGMDVTMLGCVGDDLFGEELIKSLKDEHISVKVLRLTDTATGTAAITVYRQDNRIILAGGANHKLTVDILKQYEEVLEESDIILLQNEIPFEVNDYVLHTYCSSARILYNAAPAMEIDRSLYPRIHTLIINQSECEYLLRSEIKDQSDAMNAAKTFSDLGVKNAVVTLGKRGAAFCDGVQTGHVGIIQVQAVDATGAGDSFCAGVAKAVLHGERLEEAVKFATKVAALSVMKKGAQNSMPFLNQVMDQ